ncbi:polysaccharide pyruvyl transferase family protein [Enterococcus sp. AZ072]|uniref:polysaccharide pyruvyl transferase family protein n=1 Tax=unclassified Enterococcus TaxID=2608891 RepID=UPI003D2A5BBD
MKIGIMTFHFAYNYGAALQAYGLCTFLRKNGYDAMIIDYMPKELEHLYTLNPFCVSRKKEIFSKLKKYFHCKKQFKKFDNFLEKNDLCTDKIDRDKLSNLNNIFDVFIVGSDQIWNPKILTDSAPYYLDFVTSDRRKIAYAASFGVNKLSPENFEKSKENLKQFDWISIREKSGVDIVNNVDINAELISDPVFLLDKDDWELLENPVDIPKHFIFYYALEYNADLDRKAIELSQQEKAKIVIVHSTCERISKISDGIRMDNIGPEEFLYLMRNAAYVITDSFHATAFGLIFSKNIINISSETRSMRAKNLLLNVGLENCINENEIIVQGNENIGKKITDMRKYASNRLLNVGLNQGEFL